VALRAESEKHEASYRFLLAHVLAERHFCEMFAKKTGSKSKNGPKVDCDRPNPYSIATQNTGNPEWANHTYHPQVWYMSLDDIHDLWLKNYFDYVIDVRGLDDSDANPNLLGWEAEHIPGSYPTDIACLRGDCDEILALEYFLESGACLDAKIFVHCWVGVAANQAVEILVKKGFTNLYSAGPERGNAGWIAWKTNGFEIVEDDIYDPDCLIPQCYRLCNKI
jgi:rhodanese-related sulfurtransferase